MAWTDNLVGFFPLSANNLPYTDLVTGYGVIAELNADTQFQSGAPGPAWLIETISGALLASGVTLAPPFAIAVQIHATGSGTGQVPIGYAKADTEYYTLSYAGSTLSARTRKGGDVGDTPGVAIITTGAWNDIALLVAADGSPQAYCNGAVDTAAATPGIPAGSRGDLCVGNLYRFPNAANGTIGQFLRNCFVWNGRKPSAAEVTEAFASLTPPPTIGTQPTAQSVTAPAAATFTASVSGTYTGLRWQRQAAGAGAWADVSGGTGGTTTSYTTGATAVSGGSFNSTDRFRLAVDWSGGIVYSTDVALTVAAGGTAPAITVQPSNQTATLPAAATFSVTATGSGTKTYQWQRNPLGSGSWADISGATSASYTTPATTISGGSANNTDTYRCVVTGDTSPPATSNAAVLTVQQPLATVFTFTMDGAVSLTGLKYAVFDQVTPDLWAAPIIQGANETCDASGVVSVTVTGLTARRIGELGSAYVTNSDGTATGGSQAATRRGAYYVGAFS